MGDMQHPSLTPLPISMMSVSNQEEIYSPFSEHILNAEYEMRLMEEIKTTSQIGNDPKKINALEDTEMMKASTRSLAQHHAK